VVKTQTTCFLFVYLDIDISIFEIITPMSISAQPSPAPLLVACLCAQWCGVCREYRSRFDQVKAAIERDHPQAQFLWIDVEDEADLLHPVDVEDFPTLLIAVGDTPHFFGPLTPQAAMLERMVRTTLQAADTVGLADPVLRALVARLKLQKV
jgi:thiol-disulfide isomerase/thioredoxin